MRKPVVFCALCSTSPLLTAALQQWIVVASTVLNTHTYHKDCK